jgi:hypothetical protein
MRGTILARLFALSTLLLAGPASAQTARRTAPETNAEIVARTPNALGVFKVQADGRILHLQSGFLCPAALPSMSFWHAEVFARTGADVGCDYGRADLAGHSIAKLTLFLVKGGDRPLDAVFEGYKAEAARAMPTLSYRGPALTVESGQPDASSYGDYRSAEFVGQLNGVDTDSQLLVAIRRGWILELRLTYRTQVGDIADAENLAKDAASAPIVFLQALKALEAGVGATI